MAELFTEEDVIKYARLGHVARRGCGTDATFDEDIAAARAVLSALAEDGRLRPAGDHDGADPDMMAVQSWEDELVRAEAAKSGGALPSDTPALAADSESNP